MGIPSSVARTVYTTLSERFQTDGEFYFEMWIRTPNSGKIVCDMAIHFTDPADINRDSLLVGIEVKDWSRPVYRSVVLDEYHGYAEQFDLFFLAANEFAPSALDIDEPEIGLLTLANDGGIVSEPVLQETHRENRHAFIKAINRNWQRNNDRLRSLYPELVPQIDGDQQVNLTDFDVT